MGKLDIDARPEFDLPESGDPADLLTGKPDSLPPAFSSISGAAARKKADGKRQLALARATTQQPSGDGTSTRLVREETRKLSLSLFFREQSPLRSLGFTSAIGGEGKSFMALMTASVLARDSDEPVILVDTNWEHPTLHSQVGLPQSPGLAEWLRGECDETDVCHQVAENLGVIPAGNEHGDAVKLLRLLHDRSIVDRISSTRARYIFDLPPVVTCAYGRLAASAVESVVVVVRAGITPENMVVEACSQLKDLPIEGIFLNQVSSRIPRWLLRIL